MSKHKYRNNYELPTSEEETVTETVKTEVETEADEFCEACQIAGNVESEDPIEEPITTGIRGTVSGCEKLNVRSRAAINSDPVCVINKDDTVFVDIETSTADWYKVCTEAGVEGFCMKQYITITE